MRAGKQHGSPRAARSRQQPVNFRRLNSRSFAALRFLGIVLACWCASGVLPASPPANRPEPILLLVMDPLSKELACACVKGYGQRDYRKLASRLESVTKQRVRVEFSDDLAESLKGVNPDRAVIAVGDQSIVAYGATKAGRKFSPVCSLTGMDGSTAATGLFVARADDPAKGLKDISGRNVLLGLPEGDEKHAAALATLRDADLMPPARPANRASYSDAALDMLDNATSPPSVAVIPGFALRLLEGCGSVKPGSLKVIGQTQPVPFITVFFADKIPAATQEKLLQSLLTVKADAKLLKVMESRDGFVPLKAQEPAAVPKATSGSYWPDWRGLSRDGHVPQLPARLPAKANLVWKKAAMSGGLAGLSVSSDKLILAERDFADEQDMYRCLNTVNGEVLWSAYFPARGKLDYGQSPRATPVIHAGRAYLLGAFGGLRCVDLATGKVIWQRRLLQEFRAPLPKWGMCSTPLIVDGLIIVNPGGSNGSLAALDCATGRTRWTSPGLPPAYSAFICAELGNRRQIVGYDQRSLGGWDPKTGERLWQLIPPAEGDFNVPTPIAVDGGVLVSTENNGTRLYRFDESGRIITRPAAECSGLSPTTASPVVTCGRIFGAHAGLLCLDLRNGLNPVWHCRTEALDDHSTFIADDERVLVVTLGGELLLLDGKANECKILSRLRIFEEDVEVYSHPALAGTRLYARGGSSVVCVDLGID